MNDTKTKVEDEGTGKGQGSGVSQPEAQYIIIATLPNGIGLNSDSVCDQFIDQFKASMVTVYGPEDSAFHIDKEDERTFISLTARSLYWIPKGGN